MYGNNILGRVKKFGRSNTYSPYANNQDLRTLSEQWFYVPNANSFANEPVTCVSAGLVTNSISFLGGDFNAKIVDFNGAELQVLTPMIVNLGSKVFPQVNEIHWFDIAGMQGDYWVHEQWKGKILVLNGKFETTAVTADEINQFTGIIAPFAGNINNIPERTLPCDGRAVSRYYYSNLFDKIGTAWGVGDGSNTFNLPDLRSATLKGVGSGILSDPDRGGRFAHNGGNGGDNVGSYQRFAFQYQTTTHRHYMDFGYRGFRAEAGGKTFDSNGHDGKFNNNYTMTEASLTYGTGNSTRDNNTAVHFIIFI